MESYDRVNWQDYPRTETPVTADNLNQMEDGIAEVTDEVIKLENGTSVADTATHLTKTTVGSNTRPIYLNNGNPQECNPATAVSEGSTDIVTSGAVYMAAHEAEVSALTTAETYTNRKVDDGITTAVNQAKAYTDTEKAKRIKSITNAAPNITQKDVTIAANGTGDIGATFELTDNQVFTGVAAIRLTNKNLYIYGFETDFDNNSNPTVYVKIKNTSSSAQKTDVHFQIATIKMSY